MSGQPSVPRGPVTRTGTRTDIPIPRDQSWAQRAQDALTPRHTPHDTGAYTEPTCLCPGPAGDALPAAEGKAPQVRTVPALRLSIWEDSEGSERLTNERGHWSSLLTHPEPPAARGVSSGINRRAGTGGRGPSGPNQEELGAEPRSERWPRCGRPGETRTFCGRLNSLGLLANHQPPAPPAQGWHR